MFTREYHRGGCALRRFTVRLYDRFYRRPSANSPFLLSDVSLFLYLSRRATEILFLVAHFR